MKNIVNQDVITGTAAILDHDLTHRYVGNRLNVLNSRDALAAIAAPIQSDSIDLTTGDRTLTLGNTNQPDALDFVSRIEWFFSEKKQLKVTYESGMDS